VDTRRRNPAMSMVSQLKPAIVILALLTIITGFIYPLTVTVIAQVAFPHQANGSIMVTKAGEALGSELIGQPFSDPRYFWGRLSATGPFPYNAAASSGSNNGPLSPALTDAAQARITALRQADPNNAQAIPVDLVTASGSGLDPHISIAAALYQVPRVARARGLDEAQLRETVARFTEGRQFGILVEPRVNVLRLNLALDGIE
jgi:potassium-transporting ATPase KdpC subunit